jgi:hypothetical protein
MVARTVKRFFYGTLGALGVAFALFAFYLLSRTAQDASQFDRWQELILLINIAVLKPGPPMEKSSKPPPWA